MVYTTQNQRIDAYPNRRYRRYVTSPTLSIIIPAFDEENYIEPCLIALLAQSGDIDEIIVVDNNSTDSTARIVERYARTNPMIRLIEEREPGVVHARDAGFAVATGDIYGRVDADTRVRPGWARTIKAYFANPATHEVGAISGLNNSYDSPFRRMKGWWVDKQIENGNFGGLQEFPNLHGANMAIRSTTWHAVSQRVSKRDDVHEDLDLALCVDAVNGKIDQLTDLFVDVSPRRALTPPRKFTAYLDAITTTYELHGHDVEGMRRGLRLRWWFHALLWILHLPYDPARGRYSLRKFLSPNAARDLPIKSGAARSYQTRSAAA